MNKTALPLSSAFRQMLHKYVEDLIVRVTSDSTSQAPTPIDPAFSLACADLDIWFVDAERLNQISKIEFFQTQCLKNFFIKLNFSLLLSGDCIRVEIN